MTDEFKIFQVQPIGGVGIPVIVTTVSLATGGIWIAEYFVLLPVDEDSFFAQEIVCNTSNVPEELFIVDEPFMFEEALNQAKWRLEDYLFQNSSNQQFSRQVEVAEGERRLLASYWMRAPTREHIHRIQSQTRCTPLKRFIDVVVELPAFSHR